MEKNLKIDADTAKRIYPTSPQELKEILEETFGKSFFSEKITDRIKNYDDVLSISGVRKGADEVVVEGFSNQENEVVRSLIKKIRTVKAYNEGWLPSRGEKRWCPWWNVSSGFVFVGSGYGNDIAGVASAARLCLKNKELSDDYAKKFIDLEQKIIGF